jgi:hypothetical protein
VLSEPSIDPNVRQLIFYICVQSKVTAAGLCLSASKRPHQLTSAYDYGTSGSVHACAASHGTLTYGRYTPVYPAHHQGPGKATAQQQHTTATLPASLDSSAVVGELSVLGECLLRRVHLAALLYAVQST